MTDKPNTPLPPTRPVRATLPPTTPTAPAPPPRMALPLAPPARPQPLRPEPGPPPRRWPRLLYLGLGWAIALIVAIVSCLAFGLVWFYRSDMIMPGVYAGDLALGGLSQAEAITLIEQQGPGRQIVLAGENATQTVTPQALGLSLDATATAQLAYQQGRSLATLADLLRSRGRLRLTPPLRFEGTVARQTLQEMAPQFERPPIEADIRFVNGQVEVVPAVAGRAVDIPATLNHLAQNPAQVAREGRLPLAMTLVEPNLSDVSGVAAQANAMLSHSLSVQAYDPVSDETLTWQLEPAIWGAWLSLALEVGDPPQLAWSLDEAKIRAYATGPLEILGDDRYLYAGEAVAAIAEAVNGRHWSARLRVYHRERQHTVQYGQTLSSIGYDYGIPYPWIEQVNSGISALRPGQVITIPSPDELLPLPIVEDKRLVISLSQQKLWAYEDGALKWEWPVSSGIASSPTAPGIFQVQTHELNAYAANWNLWMPHFMGIYRPVPTSDFMNGFHGFPTRNGSTLLWTGDLGHPVTYGCILLSSDNAALLYDWAEAGVVVDIQK